MIDKSFLQCRCITQQAKSSFPLAFRLLPPHKRRAMDALYAFMRVTDDLADEPGEPDAKRRVLSAWRAGLADALAGRYSHPVHAALHDTVRRFAIPPRFLFDVIDGVESDLRPTAFATFADLYPYCYRVASAVGLACVRVWGLRPGVTWDEADVPAEAAGIAFQLTNILRDLGEDRDRGRVYLPRDEWPGQSTAEALRFQVSRARDFYRRAEPLSRLLTPDGRAIFGVMCGTYRALLEEVVALGPAVLTRRARVPKWRKAALFAAAWPVKWGLW